MPRVQRRARRDKRARKIYYENRGYGELTGGSKDKGDEKV